TPSSPLAGSPYAITCTAGTLVAGNYAFAFVAGNLTITHATLTVTADDVSRKYGQPDPTFTGSFSGFKNGETLATSGVIGSPSCTSAATAASAVAGSPYAITCTAGTLAAGNYGFTFVAGNLTITLASLTVTANDVSREYGDANPAFDATITGFKNGETAAMIVTGSPGCTSAATPTT